MYVVPHQHLGTALNIFLIASVATIATGLGKHTINHSIILNLLGFISASIIHYMTSSDLSMNGISPILGYLRRRAGEDPSHQLCHAVLLIFSVSGGATIYSLGFRLSVVVWHGLVLVILGWMAFTASTTSGQADYDSGSFNEPPVREEDLNSIPSVLMTREDFVMFRKLARNEPFANKRERKKAKKRWSIFVQQTKNVGIIPDRNNL